ncbi:SAM-dependent methyltransferase [Halobacteriales archaeon QS_7_69_60]|nr:MAG: SAM-dependent methyltransferase [Halobacteriales archaeon QS_7_69_60]
MDRFRNTAQPDRDWWTALWPDPEGTLREVGIDGGTLADVACGDGHFTLPAANLTEYVYAVDLDAELLGRLEGRLEERAVENVEPIEGDARELPSLLPERIDTVLLANTFHGVDSRTGFAMSVRDVLQTDGCFVVVNWQDRPPEKTTALGEPRGPPAGLRMTPDETVEAVEPAGFEAVEITELDPHHYGVVFRRT